MTETIHALAQQLVARDRALAHAHDDRGAHVRDKIASLIAADELAMSDRNKRFEDLIKYMTAAHEAENASAIVQREAAVAALLEEIDFHTRTSDIVIKGDPVMPVAAQIRSEAPANDLQTMDPSAFDAAIDKLIGVEVLPPEETHSKPKIVRAA